MTGAKALACVTQRSCDQPTRGVELLRIRRLVWILFVTQLAAACVAQDPSGSTALQPAGMTFPYVVSPACPGEGCTYGEWMACDSVRVYGEAEPTAKAAGWLLTDEPFTVETGMVIVRRPGAVLVTARTPQHTVGEAGYYFESGDTLFVFNYLGEGFFASWHRGEMLETEVFWPWDSWYPAEGHQYTGEILQEANNEFWVSVSSERAAGWVWVDSAHVAMANSLDPWPPECR